MRISDWSSDVCSSDLILTADPRTASEPPPWIGVDELDEYSVNLSARAWVGIADYSQYRADLLHRVKEAFDLEGIAIPYPHAGETSKGAIELRFPPLQPDREPTAGPARLHAGGGAGRER